ncbi:hypothetical protein MUO14_05370 [Halobacillus shinanisalinarum]|uniref:DUF8042 domain-containing protein n=1 Tax=Halobacillus shinanisalinarum TaxID=2932258 RepID=A0ABY4H609_9BACI|nr:hypothetical protein [Halobacillus shinanisalinarum]UOQ94387.1 hypothetical protein MUO14_05370 [Halobacillus shinanisalinarum]
MSELTAAQHHMLQEYKQLLAVISEGFEYLENNLEKEALPQVQQVFEDILVAFQQISHTHESLLELLQEEARTRELVNEFHDIVKLLEKWFTLGTNQEKRQLLIQEVIPVYENWRSRMQSFINPYTAH